jgi:squalene-associated FAD-dependent desaturase
VKARVAVIGAGWSGLAAAVALLDAGLDVTLIDAAPQVGGRARRVSLALGDRTYALDNGQHLMLGAYRDYRALATRVGVAFDARFLIKPFALRYPDGFRMVAARAPAPLHLAAALAFARGLGFRERYAAAVWVQAWKKRGWSIDEDRAAVTLFAGHPASLVERLWGPLCLAALNVRLEEASARMFLRVLGDTLGAPSDASDLLLARADLSALFPNAAERAFLTAGGQLRLRDTALALECIPGSARWCVRLRSGSIDADAVVLALPPARCTGLMESAAQVELRPAIDQLARIGTAPIATVYLRYPAPTRLAQPLFALLEQPQKGDYGQWVFDRGLLDANCAGILSVVVSGSGPHTDLSSAELGTAVARQITRDFALPEPVAQAVLVEKRATVIPAPGLVRPPTRLPVRGLYLAGDAADSPYPSTLEGSVRAGLAAARAAIEDLTVSAA